VKKEKDFTGLSLIISTGPSAPIHGAGGARRPGLKAFERARGGRHNAVATTVPRLPGEVLASVAVARRRGVAPAASAAGVVVVVVGGGALEETPSVVAPRLPTTK